jgi:glyoxylase-like metal-dependent hydrolase (beta-lactamase superfamily II)
VIIDPGFGAESGVAELVAEHRLKPVAVMLTHGHLDHMFSVTPLCRSSQAVCWVHPADRNLLADPLAGMGPETRAMLAQLVPGHPGFVEPDEVRELVDATTVEVAGIDFRATHAPGHTPGSTMYQTHADATPDATPVVFSGDVLFAGSIGRTDLPGGDLGEMLESLRTKVLTLPDPVVVLPGHGPSTTMATERATNPYLRQLQEALP